MKKKRRVLIVDNDEQTIYSLIDILKDDYQLNAATSGANALIQSESWKPDLIMIDVAIPDISGLNIFLELKNNYNIINIPVIITTLMPNVDEETYCINIGAVDYIKKPYAEGLLKAKIKNYIDLRLTKDLLNSMIENKRMKVGDGFKSFLFASLSASEFRAVDVGKWHIQRCFEYAKVIVKNMIGNLKYPEFTTTNLAEATCFAVPYHDIGKSILPDDIILKPDTLTYNEYEVMKTHTTIGRDLIEAISGYIKDELCLNTTLDVIKYHHERWDGSGYPEGLSGENIPLSARIMAIIDFYDTLVSKRVYKDSHFHFEAVKKITAESGKGFDPDVVLEFLQVQDELLEIMKKYNEEND